MSTGKALVFLASLAFAGVAAGQSAAQLAPKDIKNIQDALANAGTKSIADARFGIAGSPFKCTGDLRYVPLPTFDAKNYTKTSRVDGKLVSIETEWPTAQAEINKLLPNISTQIGFLSGHQSGSVGGIFGASSHREHIAIDFMKYRSEDIVDAAQNTIAYARVGAGMRLIIDVVTTEASIGGSLISLAVSAKAGRTSGSISVDVVGINAKDITLSMPFTTDLSEGSIQKIIEALAIVKSKISDDATTLTPQYIARVDCVEKSK
ncbi:MAG: hypothetical protein Q7K57_20145 [Burkholderiaceae bacterium]|uniref:hypothetical protein n=1 Tax=Polaromonas sp. YR568 TaxID=1855301 RepID=UPI0027158947|nr:hypothetical protein [Polaromonas sp.]MDO8770974.1 hypothetical protein [Burkholderiaceae bacterium]